MRGDQVLPRIIGRPLLCEPGYLQTFISALSEQLPGQKIEQLIMPDGQRLDAEAMRAATAGYTPHSSQAPFDSVNDVAVIGIQGTIVPRTGNVRPVSGMVGVDGIAAALDAAIDDDSIRGVLLHIDSPGGEVGGVFDLADEIHAARKSKPIWCVADELAASAAYCIASAADRIILPRTGRAGSIGVVLAHVDNSKRLANQGLSVTLIHAGTRKVDGNSLAPLPDDVRDRLQQEVNAVQDMFVSTVARGRSMSESAVRATEASIYMGADAVKAGLADEVAPAADAVVMFNKALRSGTARRKVSATSKLAAPARLPDLNAIATKAYGQPEQRDHERAPAG